MAMTTFLPTMHLHPPVRIPPTLPNTFATASLSSNHTYLVELAADSAGLLGTQVEGDLALALVELAQVGTLLLVHDGEHAGNVLAQRVDAQDLARRATGHLLDAQVEQLGLELLELLGEVTLGLRLKLERLNNLLVVRSSGDTKRRYGRVSVCAWWTVDGA